MLILSRRQNEKLLFPGISTSVQIISVKTGVVRLGIEAPDEVCVLREEVWEKRGRPGILGGMLHDSQARCRLQEVNHILRNQQNNNNIAIELLRRQLRAGLVEEAEQTLKYLEKGNSDFQEEADNVINDRPRKNVSQSQPVKRALLAEDNNNERDLFAGLLRMSGIEVDTAQDGESVLNYLEENDCPDVLLLDMVLPGKDGPATLREIRNDPELSDLKVFAISGHDPDYFGLKPGPDGYNCWFQKPIKPEKMLQELYRELTCLA